MPEPTEPTLDTYRRFLQLAYNGLCGALGELRAAQVYDLAEWVTAIRAAVADRQFPENAPHPGASLLADLAEKDRRIGELGGAALGLLTILEAKNRGLTDLLMVREGQDATKFGPDDWERVARRYEQIAIAALDQGGTANG